MQEKESPEHCSQLKFRSNKKATVELLNQYYHISTSVTTKTHASVILKSYTPLSILL